MTICAILATLAVCAAAAQYADPETALAGGLALRGVAQSRVRSVVRIHGDRLHLDADAVSERTPEAEMIEMIINEDITYLELRPLLHHRQGFRERDEVYTCRDQWSPASSCMWAFLPGHYIRTQPPP